MGLKRVDGGIHFLGRVSKRFRRGTMRPDVADQPEDGFCDSYRIGPRFTRRAHDDAFAHLSLEEIEKRENLYRNEHPGR